MQWLLLSIFATQGLAMFFDEFYFHRKRGLPRWERIGHPIDTISVLAVFLIALTTLPTQENIYIFIGLSLFSCLLVTKDEFVHKEHCPAGETWLHAVLFVLHPLVFVVVGFIWYSHGQSNIENIELLWLSLKLQLGLIVSFLIYQIIYWSFICKTEPT